MRYVKHILLSWCIIFVMLINYHILFELIIKDIFYEDLMNEYNFLVNLHLVILCMYVEKVIMDVVRSKVKIIKECMNQVKVAVF
jgi:hypothetical protein